MTVIGATAVGVTAVRNDLKLWKIINIGSMYHYSLMILVFKLGKNSLTFLGDSKSQRPFKLHYWFRSFGNFAESVIFTFWWSFSSRGSAMNGATPSSFWSWSVLENVMTGSQLFGQAFFLWINFLTKGPTQFISSSSISVPWLNFKTENTPS